LTSAGGRRFGFTVGPAFMLLAVVLAWRDRTLAAAVTAGLGAVLVLAALLVPGRLGPVFRAWMGLAHAISRVTTPIVLGVVFFAVITPLGLLRRLFGKNPISRSRAAASYWVTRRGPRGTMSNQF
jgi:hypothetical protein